MDTKYAERNSEIKRQKKNIIANASLGGVRKEQRKCLNKR